MIKILLVCTSFLICFSSHAKQKQNFIDLSQQFISSGWIGFNHDIDMYFSGSRYSKTKNKSKLLFSYTVKKSESDEVQKAVDFGIKVHLPKLSKKLSIVIEKQRDEILEAQQNESAQTVNTPERGYTAGVKYLLARTPFFKTSLDTGIRLVLPLDPFAKLKFFNLSEFSFINIYTGQKFIFFRQDGYLRSITELNFIKRLNRTYTITQANSLTWTDETDLYNLRNSLRLTQYINDKSNLTYTIGANAGLKGEYQNKSYDTSITYQRKLYRDWVSGRLSIGAEYNRAFDYDMDKFVLTRLDVLMK